MVFSWVSKESEAEDREEMCSGVKRLWLLGRSHDSAVFCTSNTAAAPKAPFRLHLHARRTRQSHQQLFHLGAGWWNVVQAFAVRGHLAEGVE